MMINGRMMDFTKSYAENMKDDSLVGQIVREKIASEKTEKTTPAEIANNLSLEMLEKSYGEYEVELKRIKKEYDLLHDAILLKFDQQFGTLAHSWTNPETGGTLTRSKPVSTEINQTLAKKLMTSAQYAVTTVTKVTLPKIKAAIEANVLSAKVIAPAITTETGDTLTWYPAKK